MRCALFDLDGTIADTEILKAQALARAIEKLGGNASPDIYKAVMGQSWEVVTNAFFQHSGISEPLETFNPIFRECYAQLIESYLIENRSADRFLKLLKEKGFRLGLVSSASPWMIERALTKLRLQTQFDVIISNVDTQNHKPHPEAYLKALEILRTEPKDAIAFEDSESGILAATRAGLTVYGVHHAYNEAHDFALCKGTITSFHECLTWDLFLSGKPNEV